MKQLFALLFVITFAVSSSAFARQGDEKLKAYINDVITEVKQVENSDEKKTLLNNTLDELIAVFSKIEEMEKFTEEEKAGITQLKKTLTERKDELNGENGFSAVPNNQLNHFADFIQQDIEQAQTYITISAGLAVIIILLLLLL